MRDVQDSAHLKLLLDLCQLLHLLSQFERRHDRVATGQRHEGGTGERPVGVQPTPRPLQRVVVLLDDTVTTLARDRVGTFDRLVTREEHLDDLVVVVVGGEDEWGDVGRELTLLLCPEERVADALPSYLQTYINTRIVLVDIVSLLIICSMGSLVKISIAILKCMSL